jgi:hypothetical protein
MMASGGPRDPHVAIGGVGGSGTNLIAAITHQLGVNIGFDVNSSQDNLAWTLLFKRPEVLSMDDAALAEDLAIFVAAMTASRPLTADEAHRITQLARDDRPQHPRDWLAERAARLSAATNVQPDPRPWGWKEPNTHVLLPFLARQFPAMRYVHVVRHGLDMAFSSNQNQLAYWAGAFEIPSDLPAPVRALRYWLAVQKRARALGASMGARFLWLDYDAFCANPVDGVERLQQFLGLPRQDPQALADRVEPQPSHGRYRSKDCSVFDAVDVEAVRALGFEVDLQD